MKQYRMRFYDGEEQVDTQDIDDRQLKIFFDVISTYMGKDAKHFNSQVKDLRTGKREYMIVQLIDGRVEIEALSGSRLDLN